MVSACGFYPGNKVLSQGCGDLAALQTLQISDQFFSFDISEILVQRGFRKDVSPKIRFSKNLDIKILRTKDLEPGDSASLDRHGLDHDHAIEEVGARSDVTVALRKTESRFVGLVSARVELVLFLFLSSGSDNSVLGTRFYFPALAILTPRDAAAYRAMPLYSASAICSRYPSLRSFCSSVGLLTNETSARIPGMAVSVRTT
jgi:hypothetical protein